MVIGVKLLVDPSPKSSGLGIAYNESAAEVFITTMCHPKSMLDDELRCIVCGHSYDNETNQDKKAKYVRYWSSHYISAEQAASWVAVWMEVDQSDVYVKIDRS